MAQAQINDSRYEEPITYYIEDWLKEEIDTNVKPALAKKDKDFLICIDGNEGAGKSIFGFQVGKYIDPTLTLKRVVFNAEDFRQAIFKAKKGEVVIYDEAFTGLSSRASLSGVNRALVSLMMQMRQKNLCVILVLPTFFLLDKYAALFRARVLFHVYENKGRRGYFRCYGRKLKKLLYLYGKKDYSYPRNIHTKRKGHFYGVFALGDAKEEELYRKAKAKALEDTEKNPMTAIQVKYKEQRDLLLFITRKSSGLTYRELENYLAEYDFEMNYVQIRNICAKFGDKEPDKTKGEAKAKENELKGLESDENEGELDESENLEPKGRIIGEKVPEIDDFDDFEEESEGITPSLGAD